MQNRGRQSKKTGQKPQSYRLPPESQNSETQYENLYSLSVSMMTDSNLPQLNSARKVQNGMYLVSQSEISCKIITSPRFPTKKEKKQEAEVDEAKFLKFQNGRNKQGKQMEQELQEPEKIENRQLQEIRSLGMECEKQKQVNEEKVERIEQMKTSIKQTEKMEVQE